MVSYMYLIVRLWQGVFVEDEGVWRVDVWGVIF